MLLCIVIAFQVLLVYGTTFTSTFSQQVDVLENEPVLEGIFHRPPYKNLVRVYEACNLEFAFPSDEERLSALATGKYNPDVPVPIDVDVYFPSNHLRLRHDRHIDFSK